MTETITGNLLTTAQTEIIFGGIIGLVIGLALLIFWNLVIEKRFL